MTEQEEAVWRLMELKQEVKQIKMEDNLFEAVLAAQQFVEDTPSHELSIMTLRKAFELGFRKGRA
jgi:hypothetical protein